MSIVSILSIQAKALSCGKTKIFFSEITASVVVIILQLLENLLYKRLLVSSAKAIVGTIMTIFWGCLIAIKASMMKLLPKLVGALTAKLFPFRSFFSTCDCAVCSTHFSFSPISVLKASQANRSSQMAFLISIYGKRPTFLIR